MNSRGSQAPRACTLWPLPFSPVLRRVRLAQQWLPQNASQPEAPGASPISQSQQTSRHLATISAEMGAAALGVPTARRRRGHDLKVEAL